MTEPAAKQAATILIVDDEAHIRTLLEHALSFQGYGVLSAESAEEGLGLMRQHRPDLVVTDLNMPGRDGLELIKDVRSDPALRLTPILAITGNITSPLDLVRQAGADAILLKPFKLTELLEEIGRLLALERS